MKNYEHILNLIETEDESLSGCCWERFNYSYHGTPKEIIDDVIETYMNNEIWDMEDVTETDKKLAMAKYLNKLADELTYTSDINYTQIGINTMKDVTHFLPFDIVGEMSRINEGSLEFEFTVSNMFGKDIQSINFSLEFIENLAKKDYGKNLKTRSLYELAKTLCGKYQERINNIDKDQSDRLKLANLLFIKDNLERLIEDIEDEHIKLY